MTVPLAILSCAALLVPRSERSDWLAEWRSELWYLLTQRKVSREALSFCVGAFPDALWMRRNRSNPQTNEMEWLRSPVCCLFSLATIGAAMAWLGGSSPIHNWNSLRPHVMMPMTVLLILPFTTDIEWSGGFRGWLFLMAKILLLLAIVFFGTFDLSTIASTTRFQPHAALIGYLLAFRWAFADQKRRCPQCLRLLSHPVRFGRASYILTEWYGTEMVCSRGHGLLHIPELARNSCSQVRWLKLDPSWSGLFQSGDLRR